MNCRVPSYNGKRMYLVRLLDAFLVEDQSTSGENDSSL